MKPPHFLCRYCGIIITGSGHEPTICSSCDHSGFIDLGYEDEYDRVEVRARHKILYLPDRFSPGWKVDYWKGMTDTEKAQHQKQIDELNEKIRNHPNYGNYVSNDDYNHLIDSLK